MSDYDRIEDARLQKALATHLGHIIGADLISDQVALGIAKKVRAERVHGLSPKQEWVFQTKVLEPFCQPKCWRCGAPIDLEEGWDFESGEVNELCSSCRSDWEGMQ
ncbi:hypothetical protein B6V73_17135 [Thioclava sp. JM3]|uniref:hypothetical protein n=1 Tax=Thioclava sp. JM3 TaxID=1973004 RepID=UPI000B54933C|nr:hypothetical protein [Thioclava sp. JM3]OWY13512.1 hypothetical protein B6V73_17135 [Thioclava sp. JM3]